MIFVVDEKMQLVTAVILAICLANGINGRVINGDKRKRPAEAAYGYNTAFGDQDEIGNSSTELIKEIVSFIEN